MPSYPNINRTPLTTRRGRAIALALCFSMTAPVALTVPTPHAAVFAKEKAEKKPKPPKFKDICEVHRKPFSAIKNYQRDAIFKGALLGGIIGVAGVLADDALGGKRSGGDYLKGALAGAVLGGVGGYVQSGQRPHATARNYKRQSPVISPATLPNIPTCRKSSLFWAIAVWTKSTRLRPIIRPASLTKKKRKSA